MTLAATDLFCGAGGSSHGAELAGFRAECPGVCGV
jgi:site-specific DNA-cytosine methylase